MNKKSLLLLALPLIASCAAGTSIPSEDEVIANAIEAYKNTSYVVDASWQTLILRKDIFDSDGKLLTYQPLSIRRAENYNLRYQITGDTAIEVSASTRHEDLLYEFNDEDDPSKGGEYVVTNTNVYTEDAATYFKDVETGYAIREDLSADNEVTDTIMSDYDYSDGSYTPIDFDSEFRNPFEYLQAADFQKNDDGTYSLNGTKAVFMAKCYQRTSLTYAKNAVVTLDSNNLISSITINIDYVDATAYTQESTYTCVFSNVGNVNLKHTTPYSYDNPDLETLFNKVKDAKTYTYFKGYVSSDDPSDYEDDITCFYTQDVVFFHHSYDEYPDAIYTGGYDYDYKVQYSEEDGLYYAYEYNKASDKVPYAWAMCYLSGTTPLTYDTFKDIGPTFYDLSPALFYQNEDGSYSVVDELLPTIGTYFDNQFIGVHSDVLDGACTEFKMVLDGTDGFTVYITYLMEGENNELVFSISDIDNTSLPFDI